MGLKDYQLGKPAWAAAPLPWIGTLVIGLDDANANFTTAASTTSDVLVLLNGVTLFKPAASVTTALPASTDTASGKPAARSSCSPWHPPSRPARLRVRNRCGSSNLSLTSTVTRVRPRIHLSTPASAMRHMRP